MQTTALRVPGMAVHSAMNLGKHTLWGALSGLGLFYLTEELGLSPGTAGAILMTSLLFDAAIDVPIGGLLDSWRARLPSYRLPIILSITACAVSLSVFFSAEALLPARLAVPVALIALILFRVSFTVFDLADNALSSRITTDPEQRTTLSASRKLAAALAGFILAAATAWTLETSGATGSRFPLLGLALGFGVIVVVILGYRRIELLDRGAAPFSEASVLERWRTLRRCPDVWLLSLVTLVEASATPVFMAGLAYFAAAAHGSAALAGLALAVLTIGQIASLPMWWWLSRRFGKWSALRASHVVGALAAIAFFACAQQGRELQGLAVLAIGVAGGGVSTLRWSIAPDIVDESERLTGVRVEGGILSLLITSIQVGAGLAAGILGLGLAALGHPKAAVPVLTMAALIAGPATLAHAACAVILRRRAGRPRAAASAAEPVCSPADA